MRISGAIGLLVALLASVFPLASAADDGKELAVLKDPADGHVSHPAFSADGALLAAVGPATKRGDEAFRLIVWDVGKQQAVRTIEASKQEASILFVGGSSHLWMSADGKTLVTQEGRQDTANPGKAAFRVWDGTTGKFRGLFTDPNPNDVGVTAAAMSPHGTLLAVARNEGFVKPTPERISTGVRLGEVALVDLKTAKLKSMLPGSVLTGTHLVRELKNGVKALAFSPDETQLAVLIAGEGDDHGQVKLWNLKTSKVTATLKGPKKLLVRVGTPQLAWLADGKTLVLRQGTSLEIWDTSKGEHTDAFSLTGLPVELPPGPGSLPPTGGSKEANAWKEIEQQSVLSADGARLAVQMVRVNLTAKPPKMESEVVVWDVPGRRRLGAVRLNVSAERLKTMANVLDLNRNSQNFRYDGYHHYEVAIALSPNGTRLAIGDSLDAHIQVEPLGPVRVYEVAKLPKIAGAKPADGAGTTPSGAAAVRDEFKRATAGARTKLLARFDEVINRWEKIAASGMPGAAETVARLKEEKARFETRGLAPWSEPMRAHLAEWMAAVGAARAKVQASYKGTELPAELRDLLDKSFVLASWKHQPGNGTIVLYSNGRLVDPASPHTWSCKDGVLTLRWKDAKAPGGYWVDTCHVAADGLSYTGANQIKTQVSGTLITDG